MQHHTNEHPRGAHLPLFNIFSVGSRPSVYSAYTDVNIRRLTQLTALVQPFIVEFGLLLL